MFVSIYKIIQCHNLDLSTHKYPVFTALNYEMTISNYQSPNLKITSFRLLFHISLIQIFIVL
jgi:hypothetical protein